MRAYFIFCFVSFLKFEKLYTTKPYTAHITTIKNFMDHRKPVFTCTCKSPLVSLNLTLSMSTRKIHLPPHNFGVLPTFLRTWQHVYFSPSLFLTKRCNLVATGTGALYISPCETRAKKQLARNSHRRQIQGTFKFLKGDPPSLSKGEGEKESLPNLHTARSLRGD